MADYRIERLSNGFIITGRTGRRMFYGTIEGVMGDLLFEYEGLSATACGKPYGRVVVERGSPTSPPGAFVTASLFDWHAPTPEERLNFESAKAMWIAWEDIRCRDYLECRWNDGHYEVRRAPNSMPY